MSTYVFDLEANGLDPDTIFVICGKFTGDKHIDTFVDPHDQYEGIQQRIEEADQIVCHNLIDYDRFVLNKVLGIKIPFMKCYDSLVLSRLLWPDRPIPFGYKGKGGPHSLDVWGYRVGVAKPEHEDWTQLSDDMIYRCQEDVKINELVWYELMKEAKA